LEIETDVAAYGSASLGLRAHFSADGGVSEMGNKLDDYRACSTAACRRRSGKLLHGIAFREKRARSPRAANPDAEAGLESLRSISRRVRRGTNASAAMRAHRPSNYPSHFRTPTPEFRLPLLRGLSTRIRPFHHSLPFLELCAVLCDLIPQPE
jgi:hypothetical protein